MSSWSNTDEAASAPLWSVAAIKKTPSSANRTDLFNDTTADNFISGVTMGLFNSGGRSGRVSHECLVALTNSADA
jgi:hypothetical protein